jgi:hypothetical protein
VHLAGNVFSVFTFDILSDRMPKSEKLYIVSFDKSESSEVFKFLIGKLEGAKVVNLCINFIDHLLSEFNTLISTFENICTIEVGVLVEHHLVHVEFVQISVK